MHQPAVAAARPHHIARLGRGAIIEGAGIAALILLCILFLRSTTLTTGLRLPLGATDPLIAQGFYRGETTDDGRGFRWTNGDSSLVLPAQGPGRHALRLTLASLQPTQVTISVDGRPALIADHAGPMRTYSLIAPVGWPWRTSATIRIQSATFQAQEPGGQARTLGVAVYAAEWRALGGIPWLLLLQAALIALALALLAWALAAAPAPLWLRLALAIMFAAILLAMRHSDPRFVYRWHAVLMTAGLCVFLGGMGALLRAGRQPAVGSRQERWQLPTADCRLQPAPSLRKAALVGDGGTLPLVCHQDMKTQRAAKRGSILRAFASAWQKLLAYFGRSVQETRGEAPGSFPRLSILWAVAGYTAVTALMLAPLLGSLSSHILGPRGDNFEYVWKLQWFVDALVRRHVSPVFTPQVYFPAGAELTISEITPAHNLLGLPLTWLAGPIVSYNTLTLLSFVLTASFTYLLGLRLNLSRGAAWVAGLIFAFCLERFYHVVEGHFGMMGSHWLALALYGWEGVLTRRRTRDALVAGTGLALVFWTSWHYGTTFPFILALYALVRCRLPRLKELGGRSFQSAAGSRQSPALLPTADCRLPTAHQPTVHSEQPELLALLRHWRLLAIMATIVVPLVLPLAQPYIEARANSEAYPHPYAMVLASSAAPLDYLRANPYHPLWGAWAQRQYGREGAEFYVALGYTSTLLALLGLWAGRRSRITWALALALLAGLALSLGPELQLAGGRSLALPAKWLHDHAPLFGEIRTWSRLAMYVGLCGALLAGVALTAAPLRWRRALVVAASALVLIEAASAPMLSPAAPRPVDAWLRSQPGLGAVAQIPKGAGGMNQFYALFTGKPIVQGNGKYQPALYREERDTLYEFPAAPAIRLAQRWGVEFVVVIDAELDAHAPGWRAQLAARPDVVEAYRSGGYTVYRVRR